MGDPRDRANGDEKGLEERLVLAYSNRPEAGKAFRERLRTAFAGGALEEVAGERSRPALEVRSEDGMLERTLATTPIADPARDAFRAELRDRFVAGELVDRGRSKRPMLRLVLGTLVAAAAIVLVALLVPRERQWRAVALQGDGPVRVGGVVLSRVDLSLVGSEFTRGGALETSSGRLDLAIEGLELQVQPGTRLVAAALPKSGSGDPVTIEIETGEVFVRTSDAWAGDPILVRSSDSEVVVTGTAFGVLVDAAGTCVCVAEGTVDVRPRKSDFVPCPVGRGNSFFALRGQDSGSTMPFPEDVGHGEHEHVDALLAFARR